MLMKVETIDDGRITVASEFLPILENNNLTSVEKVMAREDGQLVRNFPGRRTVRIEVKDKDSAVRGVYLKRYEPGYLSPTRKLLRRLRWPSAQDEAWREWQAIQLTRSIGIQTATPIAVGQQHAGGIVRRSFLMTAAIPECIEGDTFLKNLQPPDVPSFVGKVAELARSFHGAGFVHKDFYLGHVLVVPARNGPPQLFLIDLQRVMRPGCFRSRWVAKDLGALAYSTLNTGITRSALLRGYLTYCNISRLGLREKEVARRILRRVARLRGRQPKHDGPIQ
jgi:heptose I phosphotransferase